MILDKAIYEKLCNYCAYQERCVSDVKQKLYKLKVSKDDYDTYIEKLQGGNFLNEDRYTKYFVSAHVKKKWGKQKMQAALSAKRIDTRTIKKYLQDIDANQYNEQMHTAAEKKWRTIKGETLNERKTKLLRFLLTKGYEMKIAGEVVKQVAKGE